MTKRQEDIEALASHYDTHDTTAELASATRDEDVTVEPMVTTSLRLPRSVMQDVRDEARRAGVRPTALMRGWIEERARAATQAQGVAGAPRNVPSVLFAGEGKSRVQHAGNPEHIVLVDENGRPAFVLDVKTWRGEPGALVEKQDIEGVVFLSPPAVGVSSESGIMATVESESKTETSART